MRIKSAKVNGVLLRNGTTCPTTFLLILILKYLYKYKYLPYRRLKGKSHVRLFRSATNIIKNNTRQGFKLY